MPLPDEFWTETPAAPPLEELRDLDFVQVYGMWVTKALSDQQTAEVLGADVADLRTALLDGLNDEHQQYELWLSEQPRIIAARLPRDTDAAH